ncbi:MAG: HAD family phosphatase [Verrucomicrobiota bacterium]|nr:HAD family phosphatase [Verrucomicrobiota bacterium]
MQVTAIFDWDGVIIDSHDQHERSWSMLAEEEGNSLPQGFFKESFGMRNEAIIPRFFSHWPNTREPVEIARLADRKEHLYRQLVRAEGIEPLAGVCQLLTSLREAGIRCSVGSSTPRANIDAIMEVIGLGGFFTAITASEDVKAGKPDPEVFLKAAEKAGGTPEYSVVFEDAHVGIEAGLAAKMKVIAVATTHPAESLGQAHIVCEDLTGVTAETVVGFFS